MANTRRIRSWTLLMPVLLSSAAGAAFGFWQALSYEFCPGAPAAAIQHWPDASGLNRQPGCATLVMVVHPSCPCSRASLTELSVLMTRWHDHLTAYVLFERPDGFTSPWEQTALWNDAVIVGVTRVKDENHLGTHEFGARTSGQVLFYDAAGALRFSGGITVSRGHEGDSDGLDAIETFLRTGKMSVQQTPVYGCAL